MKAVLLDVFLTPLISTPSLFNILLISFLASLLKNENVTLFDPADVPKLKFKYGKEFEDTYEEDAIAMTFCVQRPDQDSLRIPTIINTSYIFAIFRLLYHILSRSSIACRIIPLWSR